MALRADDIPLGEQTVAQVGNDSKALLSLFFCFGDRGELHRNLHRTRLSH